MTSMAKNDLQLLQKIYDVVNRMEDKMDERFDKIEDRVAALEGFKGWILGGIGVVSIVVTGAVSWFWEHVKK